MGPSVVPVANVLPLGENARVTNEPRALRRVANSRQRVDRSPPAGAAHSLTVLSALAAANVLPSGEKATQLIQDL